MNCIDKGKYLSSILFVFAAGAVLNLVVDQQVWHGVDSLDTFLRAMRGLRSNATGLSQLWRFVGSGGTLALVYVWLIEKFLWKIPLLQGWFVRLPNLEGTWVGILIPQTKVMQPNASSATEPVPNRQTGFAESSIPSWAIEKTVLPIHVTIEQGFDNLTYTAVHPNSTNTTLAQQLVYIDRSKTTELYIVYSNEPNDRYQPNATPHDGCCKLRLANVGKTKSATSEWHLRGTYWTNKVRGNHQEDDQGTWGDFHIRWESRRVGEKTVEFNLDRFDI